MSTAIENIDRLKEAGFKENQAKALAVLFEEKGPSLDLSSINNKITSLKGDMIMWMVGLLIVAISFLFTVLNQRITSLETSVNQRITDIKDLLEKDIAENRVLIQENKVLIQKILDNQNKFQTSQAK